MATKQTTKQLIIFHITPINPSYSTYKPNINGKIIQMATKQTTKQYRIALVNNAGMFWCGDTFW